MRTRLPIAILTTLLLATRARADTPPSTIATITQNFRTFCLGPTPPHDPAVDDTDLPKTSPATLHHLLTTQKPDGSWPDIDYENPDRSAWPAAGHMSRVLTFALAFRRNEAPPEDTAALLPAIHHALAFWQAHDFVCPNWWFNQIGVPKTVGTAGVLLDTDLLPAERDFLVNTLLARSKVGEMTGQNRVWLAGNGLLRAMLTHDDALAATASKIIADEIVVTTDEGIQPDWSFHQHGPQQQFGNYGRAFASEMTHWAVILQNSPDAIPPEKLAILSSYLRDGEAWTIWRGVMDISACGRQLAPRTPTTKATGLAPLFTTWATLDPTHAADFHAFANRNTPDAQNDLLGTRYYFRSDYLIHRTPTLAVTLKMHSDRVLGGETVNSENISGNHLADGALFLYQTGGEYTDIFPCWNWRMIPGTTAAQDESPLTWLAASRKLKSAGVGETAATRTAVDVPPKSSFAKPQGTSFVGGVQDNTHAVAAMDFSRDTLRAHKAWFFDGDTTTCLGAAITADGPVPIITTLNQSLLRSPVTLTRNSHTEPLTTPAGDETLDNVTAIEHDHFRYTLLTTLPANPLLQLTRGPVTGTWRNVSTTVATPKSEVRENLFTLSLDHGPAPSNATYAYEISPATAPASPTLVLANTRDLQAIQRTPWIGAIFWKSGELKTSTLHITTNHPCILSIDTATTSPHILASDPTQKLATLTLTINDRAATITLPAGPTAGSSVPIAPTP